MVQKRTKILITGASGFLGGHLVTQASQFGKVIGIYNSNPISYKTGKFYQLDLTLTANIQNFLNLTDPDLIIHNGAYTNPDLCEKNRDLAYKINVLATYQIAAWCKKKGKRLVFISTDLVFRGDRGNYSEDDIPEPLNYYGVTKLEAEKIVLDLLPNALVCRLALMFGIGVWDIPFSSEWLIRELVKRKFNPTLPPIKLFTDQWRSTLAVTNAAQLIVEAAFKSINGLLHLGAPDKISRYDLGLLLCRHFDFPFELISPTSYTETEQNVPRPKDVSLNVNRAKKLLSTPLLEVAEGIQSAFPNPEKIIQRLISK